MSQMLRVGVFVCLIALCSVGNGGWVLTYPPTGETYHKNDQIVGEAMGQGWPGHNYTAKVWAPWGSQDDEWQSGQYRYGTYPYGQANSYSWITPGMYGPGNVLWKDHRVTSSFQLAWCVADGSGSFYWEDVEILNVIQ